MSFVQDQLNRLHRARQMGPRRAAARLREHGLNVVSPRLGLRRLSFALDRFSVSLFADTYVERPQAGPVNIEEKLARVNAGGPFEPLDVSLVNHAAVGLIGDAKRIVEIGSGTGLFASLAAAKPGRTVVASEFNEAARNWAERNRKAENISYGSWGFETLAKEAFDLAVAVEVIEHIADFPAFLKSVARLAPRAIITTPNKNGSALGSVASTPAYSGHVREWTAGEFYWVLRAFYDDVQLFTLPRLSRQLARFKMHPQHPPEVAPCGPLCREPVLIACCSLPHGDGRKGGSP